jgi:hypothetical protein
MHVAIKAGTEDKVFCYTTLVEVCSLHCLLYSGVSLKLILVAGRQMSHSAGPGQPASDDWCDEWQRRLCVWSPGN